MNDDETRKDSISVRPASRRQQTGGSKTASKVLTILPGLYMKNLGQGWCGYVLGGVEGQIKPWSQSWGGVLLAQAVLFASGVVLVPFRRCFAPRDLPV